MKTLLFALPLVMLSGCGLGLAISPQVSMLSDSTTLRKNDCVLVRLFGADLTGNAESMSEESVVQVRVTDGIGAIYRSLQGCQTYDDGDAASLVSLPRTGEATLFLRPDSAAPIELTASTYSGPELLTSAKRWDVEFESFVRAKGPDGYMTAVSHHSQTGGFYLAGTFVQWSGTSAVRLARVDSSGQLDTSFTVISPPDTAPLAIATTSDGSLLVGGDFTSVGTAALSYLVRFKSHGQVDTGFALSGTGLDGAVRTIVVQPDGKIMIGGDFTSYNGTPRPYVARLNSDGSLDATFSQTGAGLDGPVYSLVRLGSGQYALGGAFANYDVTFTGQLCRLNSNGSLDGSFALTGVGLDNPVLALAVQSDGKVVAIGDFSNYDVVPRERILRVNTDGSLDLSFGNYGLQTSASAVLANSDGTTLIVGALGNYGGTPVSGIARLLSNGALDTTFSTDSPSFGPYALQRIPDGRIVVAGAFSAYGIYARPGVALLSSNGALDLSFGALSGGLNSDVALVGIQPDAKILVSSHYLRSFAGTATGRLARLHPDGSLDTSFRQTGTGLNYFALRMATQSDGKLVLIGGFTEYNGTSSPGIIRLNADGTRDASFSVPVGWIGAGYLQDVAFQPDGKLLISGQFTTCYGSPRPYIARLNSNGSLDTSFVQTGTGLDNLVGNIRLQSDGKILVAGNFFSYNGTALRSIARLQPDGSLDTTFALPGNGFDGFSYYSIVDANGGIFVSGGFSSYNGTAANQVARLNANGTLDTSFQFSGTDGAVFAIVPLPDGRVMIGGNFSMVGTQTKPYLARLLADGSLDPDFQLAGTGLSSTAGAVFLTSDFKLLIPGPEFFDGTFTRGWQRLTFDGRLD